MKLITEVNDNVRYITEEKDGKKSLYIEGVFLQSNLKNRNGRMYPADIMEKELEIANICGIPYKREADILKPITKSSLSINTQNESIIEIFPALIALTSDPVNCIPAISVLINS